jgi:CheY-like chemotaxis protein
MLLDTNARNKHFERLKNIEQCVQEGSELTKQLLSFTKGGKSEVRPIDLNDLIEQSSRMFGSTKKEIKIHKKYQQQCWTVTVDRNQINQVLLNLYLNAWQAMPGGGNLYLQTDNVTLTKKTAQQLDMEPGKYVKISVTDNGVGMDEATRMRIFDPFFTTKEMGRGTGLGLATAYGIIKNHCGVITAESKKGEGSTFTFYLPASEKEVVKARKVEERMLKGSETVLLVDDEEMIIDVGQDILRTLGYQALAVKSGREALDVLSKEGDTIDLVILDMVMPEMGGGETFDKMKEIDPDIKVLLSSGYSIDGEANEILQRGCSGFIQKPFSLTDLSQRLREILDTP